MKRNKIKKKRWSETTPNSVGRKDINVRRFVLTYLIVMSGFFFLIGFKPFQDIIDINGIYTNGIILLTIKILNLIHIPATQHGSIINLPSIALDVKFGCNGLEAVMIYTVAVMVFPSSLRTKVIGIIAGFLVIQLVNVARIAFLAYTGVHYKNLFDIFHIYVAQGLMIAIALGIYLLYLNYAGRQVGKPA